MPDDSIDRSGDLGTLATGRVEAFSDGVFAIAVTLLVLELHVPDGGEDVWQSIGHITGSLAAYVTSFLTILIFWVNHHTLFQSVRRVDRGLLFVNGLLLLMTSFISFSTAVLGRALQAGAYSRSAAVLYAITLGLASATFTGLWLVLRARPRLLVTGSRAVVDAALRRSLVGPALYTVAAILALFSAPASLLLDALIAAYFAFLPRHLRRAAHPPETPSTQGVLP